MTEFHLRDGEVNILDLIEHGATRQTPIFCSGFSDTIGEAALVQDGLIEKRDGYYHLTELGQNELDKYQ